MEKSKLLPVNYIFLCLDVRIDNAPSTLTFTTGLDWLTVGTGFSAI